jgi:lactoylglutathione lyase
VAAVDPATIPGTPEEQWSYCMRTPGCIELTHNHGSEKEEGKVYNTGNSDPTGTTDGEKVRGGFGHLGVTVPDVYEACARFASLGSAPMLRRRGLCGRPARPQAAGWPRLAAEGLGQPGA